METTDVLFSAYARLPSGTVSNNLYKVMALVVVVDPNNGTILEAECTLSTSFSSHFVAKLLIGKSVQTNLPEILEEVNKYYQGAAKKAIITALRIISDKFVAFTATHTKS